uniref:Uncharacterized protein n=1 Tax=Arundo donax TaxID=35708 RepID=A0A0A8YAL4_ARUDO
MRSKSTIPRAVAIHQELLVSTWSKDTKIFPDTLGQVGHHRWQAYHYMSPDQTWPKEGKIRRQNVIVLFFLQRQMMSNGLKSDCQSMLGKYGLRYEFSKGKFEFRATASRRCRILNQAVLRLTSPAG